MNNNNIGDILHFYENERLFDGDLTRSDFSRDYIQKNLILNGYLSKEGKNSITEKELKESLQNGRKLVFIFSEKKYLIYRRKNKMRTFFLIECTEKGIGIKINFIDENKTPCAFDIFELSTTSPKTIQEIKNGCSEEFQKFSEAMTDSQFKIYKDEKNWKDCKIYFRGKRSTTIGQLIDVYSKTFGTPQEKIPKKEQVNKKEEKKEEDEFEVKVETLPKKKIEPKKGVPKFVQKRKRNDEEEKEENNKKAKIKIGGLLEDFMKIDKLFKCLSDIENQNQQILERFEKNEKEFSGRFENLEKTVNAIPNHDGFKDLEESIKKLLYDQTTEHFDEFNYQIKELKYKLFPEERKEDEEKEKKGDEKGENEKGDEKEENETAHN